MKESDDVKDDKLWTYHQTTNQEHLTIGHPRQDMLFKEVQKKMRAGKVLEIGFGDGYLLQRLSERYICFGADISKKNVEQMRKKNPRVTFSQLKIDQKMPYHDDFFDCFIASEVLEHMDDKNLDTNIGEIFRVLKPGGFAFITFPAEERLEDNTCFCPNCDYVFHRWGHRQSFDNDRIDKLFSSFCIVKKRVFFTPSVQGSVLHRAISCLLCFLRFLFSFFINNMPNKYYLIILKKV